MQSPTARVEEMAVVHRVFRQGFPATAELVGRTSPGATGRARSVADHLDFLLDMLHHHHTTEDELIWPLPVERAAIASELTARMEAQHAEIHQASQRVQGLLGPWRVSGDHGRPLAEAVEALDAALVAHLDDEEAHVVPLIRTHVTDVEWELFGRRTFEKFSGPHRLIATGALEDVATAEERVWFFGRLPLPVRLVWRLVGRRRYDRHMAEVRGIAGPAPVVQRLGGAVNRLAVRLYRRSGGRIGGSAKGLPVAVLTVPGRRSGTPRSVPVVYIEHDGAYVVAGSAGGMKAEPQWFRNVRATDQVRLEIGTTSVAADVHVPDAADQDRLWQDVVLARAPFFAKYQEKAGRRIPVAVLTPRSP